MGAGVDPLGQEALDLVQDLGRRQDGVHPPVRGGPVGRLAGDGEDEVVGPGHHHPGPVAEVAHVQIGGHVQGADGRHPGVIQDPGGHHAPGAAVALPAALLRRAER